MMPHPSRLPRVRNPSLCNMHRGNCGNPNSGPVLSHIQVILNLQVEPELRTGPKICGQT
jgi:hypothetical protein